MDHGHGDYGFPAPNCPSLVFAREIFTSYNRLAVNGVISNIIMSMLLTLTCFAGEKNISERLTIMNKKTHIHKTNLDNQQPTIFKCTSKTHFTFYYFQVSVTVKRNISSSTNTKFIMRQQITQEVEEENNKEFLGIIIDCNLSLYIRHIKCNCFFK